MTSPPLSNREENPSAGFSLLYILFLVMALTIAASVALMSQAPSQASAGATLTWQRMDTIQKAAGRYKANIGAAPPTLDGLLTKPAAVAACAPDTNSASPTYRQLLGWCGPYLDSTPSSTDSFKRDGWSTPLLYNGATLVSCGPNRRCGDADDITISF